MFVNARKTAENKGRFFNTDNNILRHHAEMIDKSLINMGNMKCVLVIVEADRS